MAKLNDQILTNLKGKTSTKQDVFHRITSHFDLIKKQLKETSQVYQEQCAAIDNRIEVLYSSKSYYDAKLKFGGDTLLFHMHTNVFSFNETHPIWNWGYVKKDRLNAYCGMINVYNFLSDSFKFNRVNDAGYLIARIFINKEDHFFVEGKRRLGFQFNNFGSDIFDQNAINTIIDECILFSLDFDLLTPGYSAMQKVSISQITELTKNMKLSTDKRLGFKFSNEIDPPK
jgi:hypothetical protein